MAGTQNQPLEYEQVTYNSPDGAQMGRVSTEPISFYGQTPIARSDTTYPQLATASTYATTTNTTAVFGFDSLAAVTSVIHNLSTVVQALKKVGLLG